MKKTLFFISLMLLSFYIFSQEEVKLKDGKTIIVNPNGTWKYKTEVSTNNTFTDPRDGHVYKIITIGSQTWFAENLSFRPSEGLYWSLNNDPKNIAIYGYLYEWKTSNKVCPNGWHIPSDAEWTILTNYLGGENLAGGKMKSLTGWDSPNTGASNKSGFNAIAGGSAGSFGDGGYQFDGPGNRADFWTLTQSNTTFIRTLFSDDGILHRFMESTSDIYGYSIRCIKDK